MHDFADLRPPLPRTDSDPPLEAVLFDAGHTLIHDITPAERIASAALVSVGIDSDPDGVAAAMDRAMDSVAARWHRGDWWLSDERARELFVGAYRDQLAQLPSLMDDPDTVDIVAHRIYDTYQDPVHWDTFPDVPDALHSLRAAGIRMGVISDWGHGLETILLELELGRYLEFLVASARMGIGKPDPRLFDLALRRADLVAERCIYVGDTYVKDVLGARRAGISPVLIDRSRTLPPMDCAVVGSLLDLLTLLGVPLVPDRRAPDHSIAQEADPSTASPPC